MKNTLTDIVKELWDEEGNVTEIRVDGEDLYQKYYNKIRKQFDKILEVAGIDKKTMKIGKEYVIDYEDKELVKILIKSINNSYAKGIRLGNDNFTEEDRFKFMIDVENMIENKFKGEEKIRQKEKLYGYTGILSDYKIYAIKNTLDEFLDIELNKMQKYLYKNVNRSDALYINDVHKAKIRAIHNNNEREFFKLCSYSEDEEYSGRYDMNENDKILVLDMYHRFIKRTLKEIKLFNEKFSDVRCYEDDNMSFIDKDSKQVFLQALEDYRDTLVDEENIPSDVIKSIKEFLISKGKLKK